MTEHNHMDSGSEAGMTEHNHMDSGSEAGMTDFRVSLANYSKTHISLLLPPGCDSNELTLNIFPQREADYEGHVFLAGFECKIIADPFAPRGDLTSISAKPRLWGKVQTGHPGLDPGSSETKTCRYMDSGSEAGMTTGNHMDSGSEAGMTTCNHMDSGAEAGMTTGNHMDSGSEAGMTGLLDSGSEVGLTGFRHSLSVSRPDSRVGDQRDASSDTPTPTLVDKDCTLETRALYHLLKGIADGGKQVMFGQQNYSFNKTGKPYFGASSCDVYDVTGRHPAVFGIDTLSFMGDEYGHLGNRDYVRGSADTAIAAARQGSIVTVSSHMSNPVQMLDDFNNGNVNPLTGRQVFNQRTKQWTFQGYRYANSVQNCKGNVMYHILPGEKANHIFTAYLDKIADFCLMLQAEHVPVLMRPFHENSGSWFWWGARFCDPLTFADVWRYTVEYLRDVRQVHNCLYVYSPNGGFTESTDGPYADAKSLKSAKRAANKARAGLTEQTDAVAEAAGSADASTSKKTKKKTNQPWVEADYGLRWPGDDYIDIAGIDFYGAGEDWIKGTFRESLAVVRTFADKHGKLAAITEAGARSMTADNAQWHEMIADEAIRARMPFYLVWWNGQFAPYMTSPTRGCETADAFISLCKTGKVLLADR